MCLSCGCHLPLDNHGDPRHITLGDLVDASQAAGVTVWQAAKNIKDTTKEVTGGKPKGSDGRQ